MWLRFRGLSLPLKMRIQWFFGLREKGFESYDNFIFGLQDKGFPFYLIAAFQHFIEKLGILRIFLEYWNVKSLHL
jgi:hypothetical protein